MSAGSRPAEVMDAAGGSAGGAAAGYVPLAPAAVGAAAAPARRFAYALAPRALVWIAAGFAPWLLALLWPRLLYAVMAWEATVVAACLLDAWRLPPPAALRVERNWEAALQLGAATRLRWRVANAAPLALSVRLEDSLPASLRADERPSGPAGALWAPGGGSAVTEIAVTPRDRGPARLGDVVLRYRSGWGLAERWARAPLGTMVRVYPDLTAASVALGLPLRARQMQALRRARQTGRGREFESLRPYREGDEWRDVCWPATARLGRTVVKLREAERSQAVWVVLDCGRLMRTRAGAQSQLDAAANAALAVAAAAVQSGDRAGLLAYGRGLQARLAPASGPLALRGALDALAGVVPEDAEADHAGAAAALLVAQGRRALIVWLTEFPESGQLPAVVEAAAHLATRHLMLFAVPRSAALAAAATAVPATTHAMYQAAAALELAERRQETLRRLRAVGAQALELAPGAMAAELVHAYLDIKARGSL